MQDEEKSVFTKDVVNLATNLLNSISPGKNWGIANIVQFNKPILPITRTQGLTHIYGYLYDDEISLLENEGAIKAKVAGLWFIKMVKNHVRESEFDYHTSGNDALVNLLKKDGYINNEKALYTTLPTGLLYEGEEDEIPFYGKYAVLIDKTNLTYFIRKYTSNQFPIFNKEKLELEYLGERVSFSGEIESRSIEILIKHINATVSREEFYDTRGKGKYKDLVNKGREKDAHSAMKTLFNELRDKVEANSTLKDALFFRQHKGYGMFIDKRYLPHSIQ
jgi:hypothetical protein